MPVPQNIRDLVHDGASTGGSIVLLTGAGVSAESGIPTFRGEEGYWTVGSTVYRPEQMATHAAFRRMPRDVWRWYLYRRGVCRGADPNPAHIAIAELEESLGDRFALLTQNVDGLHLRAGSTLARTHQVHGNIDFLRCAAECSSAQYPLSADAPTLAKDDPLTDDDFARLSCPTCGGPARPHVLWFDESYDEERYRMDSALAAAADAAVMIVVGTSGATTLPNLAVEIACRQGAVLIDINPASNPFSEVAERYHRGAVLTGSATEFVPALCDLLAD